jgi:sugar/nucleoside kinase (ribokinase family)
VTAPGDEVDEPADAFDVVGIGNALVDVLSHESDAFVEANGLVKGAMTLIDTERAETIYAAMGGAIEASGGSAANTISGIASFGGAAAFIGRVHDDQLGTVFAHDLRATGATFRCAPASDGPPTGRCLIVVTPDAERTMNTYLGASEFLGPEDVDGDLIAAAQVTYLEGYLFDRPEAQEAYWKASRIAHDAGRRVSLTLSDTFCVERHKQAWRTLVSDQVDILFANDGEAMALYDVDSLDAVLEHVKADVEIAAVTCGPKGSLIVHDGQVLEIPAHPAERVVDTTGAGDLYAAGFLFGYTSGRTLEDCGRLGSMAATAVLGHTGPRPGASLAQLAAASGL